ncbi:hypothetical protein chiPu_0025081, partial [Chiloscyllium punctatum]|nr:hypothetical protein [Chiloscyllium punctatum]
MMSLRCVPEALPSASRIQPWQRTEPGDDQRRPRS